MKKILLVMITLFIMNNLFGVTKISVVAFEDEVWDYSDSWIDQLESEFSSLTRFYDVKAKKDIGWANYEAYEFYEDDYDSDKLKEVKGMVDKIAVGKIVEMEEGYNVVVKIIDTENASQDSEAIMVYKQSQVQDAIEYLIKNMTYGDSYKPMKIPGLVMLGISGLSIGAGVTFHMLGQGTLQESQDKYSVYANAPYGSDYDALWNDYMNTKNLSDTQYTIAIASYAASGVSLALGLYWTFHKKRVTEPRFALMALPNYVAFSYRF